MNKNRTITLVFLSTLLIMLFSNVSYAQVTLKDTIYINDESFEEKAIYSAKDSIYIDVKENKIHLYGEAHLEYLETNMKAGYILVDLKKNEVFASYIIDKDSNRIQMPIFKSDGEEIEAARIRYNFNSQKGYIEEVKVKQDEIYLFMTAAKRHKNGDIHFKEGRFTTCELDDPHYHFRLSRAVMIPKKRIVTGPMNLFVNGVPTPFGLPFSVIPQSKTRTHGLLFPEIVPFSVSGFGVRDLGYFFPVSDQLHTSAYLTIFNRGTWGLKNTTEYDQIYKRKGNFDVSFQQIKPQFPLTKTSDKFSILWNHAKDSKSNPNWNFTSSVNFVSDNQLKNNIDPSNSNFFSNNLRSDINLQRFFPSKPYTMGLRVSLVQNTTAKTIALSSPIFTANLTRIFPFKDVFTGTEKWKKAISGISFAYNLNSENKSTFKDSLLTNQLYGDIRNQFLNGISQNMSTQTNVGLFNDTWKFNPSIVYNNRINFQQIEKTYDSVTKTVDINQLQKAGYSQDLSFNASLSTMVYSYYKFIGKSQPLLRHILTPNFGFSYIPNLNTTATLDTGTVNVRQITYSVFERSIFSANPTNTSALITFGFNNTFELKRKSEKDTVTGFTKTKIIEALSFNGNYNLLKDTMKLSDISISLRISPLKSLNFVASSSLSPYDWNRTTGAPVKAYSMSTNKTLGRLSNTNFSTTYVLASKESKEKLKAIAKKNENSWSADYTYFSLYPERIISFDVPWKISFSHIYQIRLNQSKTKETDLNYEKTQTLSANGDLSFTKRWKIVGSASYDFKTLKITNASFTLTRDMHCWNLLFNWIPIGGNKSFLFTFRSTSSLFKDAKLNLKKPPLFF